MDGSVGSVKGRGVPFVVFENKKFIIKDEAKEILNDPKLKCVGVLSLVGKYRTGKSFLLNRVLLQNKEKQGFNVGPTIKPCTKGIWLWSKPVEVENNHHSEKFHVLIVDTEGLGAYDEEVNHDTKIFLIAVLISSLFLFNSFGSIDETSINTLSFVLNLSKSIQLTSSKKVEPEDLSRYFPSLLWLLRDFSLKLEDPDGNTITSKQYLENGLALQKGSSEVIEEKNKLRKLIKSYFPERDCYTMVRPVENEKDLQNLNSLEDSQIRKEFLEEAEVLRTKVFRKIKPKSFNGKLLSGSMLGDLLSSILESINQGAVPVIENSWNYVVQAEALKNLNTIIDGYKKDIYEFKDKNKDNPNFFSDLEKFQKAKKLEVVENFKKLSLGGEIGDFEEKLQAKVAEIFTNFNKENAKFFESKMQDIMERNTKILCDNFDTERYIKNYYDFFQDLENFKESVEESTPDFPMKKELIYEKIIQIIKKFIETNFVKHKISNEKEILTLKNENATLTSKLKVMTEDLETIKNDSKDVIEKLSKSNEDLKAKLKALDEKMKNQEADHKKSKLNSEKNLNALKAEAEEKIESLKSANKGLEKELKAKEDKITGITLANEKASALTSQKIGLLEGDIKAFKEKNDQLRQELKEGRASYDTLNNEFMDSKKKLEQEIDTLKKEAKEQQKKLQNTELTSQGEIKSLNTIIKSKDDELLKLKHVNDMSQALQGQKIEFLEREILGLKDKNSQNSELLKEKEQKIKEGEDRLLSKERLNTENERGLRDLELKLKQKEKELEKRAIELEEERKGEIEKFQSQEKKLKNREAQLSEDEEKIKEKALRFNETEMRLKEKDERIKEKEERVKEKEERIKEKEEKVNEKEEKMKESIKADMNTSRTSNMNPFNVGGDDGRSSNQSHIVEALTNSLKEHLTSLIPKTSETTKGENQKINEILYNINKNMELNQANKNLSESIKSFEVKCEHLEEKIDQRDNILNRALSIQCKICKKSFITEVFKTHVEIGCIKVGGESQGSITLNPNENANFNSSTTPVKQYQQQPDNFYSSRRSYGEKSSCHKKDNNINMSRNIKTRLKIKILKGVLKNDELGKPYIDYIIELGLNEVKWRVNRRFNQFSQLFNNLKKENPELKFPDSANLFLKLTVEGNSFHENKIFLLETYLIDISEIPKIRVSKTFRRFLELDDKEDLLEEMAHLSGFESSDGENEGQALSPKNKHFSKTNNTYYNPNQSQNYKKDDLMYSARDPRAFKREQEDQGDNDNFGKVISFNEMESNPRERTSEFDQQRKLKESSHMNQVNQHPLPPRYTQTNNLATQESNFNRKLLTGDSNKRRSMDFREDNENSLRYTDEREENQPNYKKSMGSHKKGAGSYYK